MLELFGAPTFDEDKLSTSSGLIEFFETADAGGAFEPQGKEHALRLLDFSTAVHIVAEAVAALPLRILEKTPGEDGMEPVPDHPVRRILHGQTDELTNALAFREAAVGDVLSWGAHYARTHFRGGDLDRLEFLDAGRTRIERVGGRPTVAHVDRDGVVRALGTDQVFYVPWWTRDGLRAYSPLKIAGRALGLGRAMERFALRFFGEGHYISGFVTHPDTLDDPGRKRLGEELARTQIEGRRVALLDEGMGFVPANMPLEEAQLLQARVFTRTSVAALFRLTPDRLNSFEKAATFASLDATEIRFAKDVVAPMAARFERAIDAQLLGRWRRKSGRRLHARFVLDSVLRGDPKVRAEVLWKKWQAGALSADEWRELDDQNPTGNDAGGAYYVPRNMQRSDEAGDRPSPGASRAAALAAGGEASRSSAAEAAFRVALRQTLERQRRRETHALERLKKRDAGAGAERRWYEEKLDVDRVAGELEAAAEVYAEAAGVAVPEAWARERAQAYRQARIRIGPLTQTDTLVERELELLKGAPR